MAHVDGALALNGEEHHHLAVHVEHHHTDCTLVVVSAECELLLGGIGVNLSCESRRRMGLMYAHQQVFVVTERDDFACNTQHRVVGCGTFIAGHMVDAIGMVGMAEVEVGRGELIEELGLSGSEIFRKVEVPHEADAAWAPSAAVVNPSAVLGLAACRIGVAGAPQMLVVLVLAVHEDVVRSLVKLGGVARVVAVVGAAAPIVAGRRDFQFGGLRLVAKLIVHHGHGLLVGVVAESIDAKPNLIHIGIEIGGRAFGETENQRGIVATATPTLHVVFNLDQTLQ